MQSGGWLRLGLEGERGREVSRLPWGLFFMVGKSYG